MFFIIYIELHAFIIYDYSVKSTSEGFKISFLFARAIKYSFPVFLGYIAIGIAFGILVFNSGYPVWLGLLMSLWMFAGAGQFISLGLFASGATILEACLVQLVVNARHMAYGLSMINRFPAKSPFKPYLIFALTDETFALLSSIPLEIPENDKSGIPPAGRDRDRFMFYVSVLDQCYWVLGTLIGGVAGSFIPFNIEGIGFALTAMFIVLMIEQIFRVKKAGIFIVSGLAALFAVFFIPGSITLLGGMILALLLSFVLVLFKEKKKGDINEP